MHVDIVVVIDLIEKLCGIRKTELEIKWDAADYFWVDAPLAWVEGRAKEDLGDGGACPGTWGESATRG